jgi:hypothetical protein
MRRREVPTTRRRTVRRRASPRGIGSHRPPRQGESPRLVSSWSSAIDVASGRRRGVERAQLEAGVVDPVSDRGIHERGRNRSGGRGHADPEPCLPRLDTPGNRSVPRASLGRCLPAGRAECVERSRWRLSPVAAPSPTPWLRNALTQLFGPSRHAPSSRFASRYSARLGTGCALRSSRSRSSCLARCSAALSRASTTGRRRGGPPLRVTSDF